MLASAPSRTTTRPARVDWFRVLIDLDRAGYRLPMVASVLGLNRETLKTYRTRGCEPNFRDGDAIVGLWCAVLQRPRDEVPRLLDEPLSAARVR